jgi:NADPH-dependent ferric siderophore reductase
MRRITIGGEAMAGFAMNGPASHIKLDLPEPGQERPVLPVYGPSGPVFAEGQPRPLSRTYTPRRWHPESLELDVDFLIHGDGPGSNWGVKAQPGDLIGVSGQPGGPYVVDYDAKHYVIGGDDSAIPAIGTLLEALSPSMRASVFIEIPDSSEEQEFESPAEFEVNWLVRGKHSESPIGDLLVTRLKEEQLVAGDVRVWVGLEAGSMRDFRKHLIFERGFDRSAIHTHGYWKYGAANHPDGDTGKEI